VLLVGWGGTYGSLHAAALAAQKKGLRVSHMHLRHLNPMPSNTAAVMKAFKHVIVAELNRGQLNLLLRGKFLVDTKRYCKVQGLPFTVQELVDAVENCLAGKPLEEPFDPFPDAPGHGS